MEEKIYTLDSDEISVYNEIIKERSWSDREITINNARIPFAHEESCVISISYNKVEITNKNGIYKSFEIDDYTLIKAIGSITNSNYTNKPCFSLQLQEPIRETIFVPRVCDLINCLQFFNYCNQCRIDNMKTYFNKYEELANKEICDQNFFNLTIEYVLGMLDFYLLGMINYDKNYKPTIRTNPFENSRLYREFSYKCLTSSDPNNLYPKDKCTIFNKVNSYEIEKPFGNSFSYSNSVHYISIIRKKYNLNETEANVFTFFSFTNSLIKLLSQNCVLTSDISNDINIKSFSVKEIVEHYLYTYGEEKSTSDHLKYLICYIYYNVEYSESMCELIDTVNQLTEEYLTKKRVASVSDSNLSPNRLTEKIIERNHRQAKIAEIIKENQKKNYLGSIYKQTEKLLTDEVVTAATNLVNLISPQVLLDIQTYSILRYDLLMDTPLSEMNDYCLYIRNPAQYSNPQVKEYLENFSRILCNRYGVETKISSEVTWCIFNYALITKYAQIWKSKCTIGEIGSMSIEEYITKCVDEDLLYSSDSEAITTLVYYLCYAQKKLYGISEPNTSTYLEIVNFIESAESQKKENLFEQRLFGYSSKSSKMKITYTIDDIDMLDGYEFENIVSLIFSNMGYDSYVTKSSGDQGIDVIAEKNGIKYGIQAKCYSSAVGNSAIQEAVAGKNYYNLDKVLVVTNSRFTSSAIKLAQSNGVILWDRTILAEKLLYINK